MKQYITKKQWDEIDGSSQDKILKKINTCYSTGYIVMCELDKILSIGQMIDFIGNDYFYFGKDVVGWQLKSGKYRNIREEELCDALWEAVKLKLKKTNK